MARGDLVNTPAERDDFCDQVRNALRLQPGERQLVAFVVHFAEARELSDVGGAEPADPHLDRGAAEQLVHRARCNHAPVIDHRDAVAQLLDLAEQVRVEKDRSAS